MPPTKLILASQSPRRARLLREAGISFSTIPSHIKEVTSFKKPELIVKELAYKKALSVALKHPGRPVLGSDTIVFCKGRVLNKPKHNADAMRLLRLPLRRPRQDHVARSVSGRDGTGTGAAPDVRPVLGRDDQAGG